MHSTHHQKKFVIPAQAGIQAFTRGSAEKKPVSFRRSHGGNLESRLRGNDDNFSHESLPQGVPS